MKLTITTKNLTSSTITSEQMFHLFFILWWARHTVLSFFDPIFRALPIIGEFGDWVVPACMGVVLIFAVPHICRQLRYKDLLLYLAVTMVVVGTMLLYPENAPYLQEELWRILGLAVPVYFLGICYNHDKLKKSVYWASAAGVLIMYAYQLYQLALNRELTTDNMYASYNALPSVLFLLYWAFEEKKLYHWILPVIGIILIFAYGTRGPILIMFAYIFLMLLVKVVWQKKGMWRVLITAGLAVLLLLMLMTDIMVDVAKNLSDVFGSVGFSTRVFDYFLEGSFTESKARNLLAEKAIEAINDRFLLGYGLLGDRVVVGDYPHNIVLELFCQFGAIFGSGILIGIVAIITMAVIRGKNNENKYLIWQMICLVSLKLMVTGTYTDEVNLFLLLGLSVRVLREYKKRGLL